MGTPRFTAEYSYGNADNKDILTAYDGDVIIRDEIGNPLSDGAWNYVWEHGRQLKSMSDGTITWNYTYNADGMRTSRSDGSNTYEYIYDGTRLSRMVKRENGEVSVFDFIYDAEGVMGVLVNAFNRYTYVRNLQGDIIGILDAQGTAVVQYTYDAWGNIISIEGTEKDGLGVDNPLRYRGYVYDEETGFYYVSSRYYDSEISRFINADDISYLGANGDVISYNLFAYCGNNPTVRKDSDGTAWGLALAGVGTVTMGTGISFGAIGSSIAAAIGAITPVGWAIIGTVVVVSVVAIAVNYAQSETKSDSKERITSPIGRRNNYNSRKDAKEAAKKAGGGKDPIKHSKGSHGNKRSHYHPNVKNKYRITPHGPSLHDHYYYPG